ncbi:UV-B-induced protein At3g17800, chloroplastic-like isoform X2 [Vigna umbellata]|uniref:UV-B-induced protein At3g17800, chloroplastic-like isoform X2 n=1 Tax=Vigna umbellata TaxID=87088 RepID=UPI001F5E6AAE|nr:UV-B-induced protein At3g17800, chloroplastic-like isoform X2 [Vigna umbellata]
MEKSVSNNHHLHLRTMLTPSQPPPSSSASFKTQLRSFPKGLTVRASAGRRHCEFSSLNAPLEPNSLVGKFLGGVLQNRRQMFHVAAKEELKMLSEDRDSAIARMVISQNSDEALLHRRIAKVKEDECMVAISDVMYLLILYKFSEIRVHLVPKLSSCLYNGRLEILPSKDWDLESIHSMEVLDIIRQHVSTVTGLKSNPSVRESWETTPIRHSWLARVYVASILYGYFLKSVSLRSKDVMLGNKNDMQSVWHDLIRKEEGIEDIKCYVMSFHPGSFQRCAKLRSKEALQLVESHSNALFGNGKSGLSKHDDVIVTSFSSLRRLVLEAIAFGSFLWETEDYIDNVYKLKDHELK